MPFKHLMFVICQFITAISAVIELIQKLSVSFKGVKRTDIGFPYEKLL